MAQIFDLILAGVYSKEADSYSYGAIDNFLEELTEGQSNVRVEEERVERGGWIMNS